MAARTVDIERLTGAVRGHVIRAADPVFDEARRGFNGMFDRRPAVIVRPADAFDVAAAVRWAGEADLGIGIRGGGHSAAGHSSVEGALLIDLASMRQVTVDPVGRTADAAGGCQLVDLDQATMAHDLAAPSGTFVDTGIGGLTLTGGIGYLIGSARFACDALIGAELVTADGEIRQVDANADPELLWALRGGGGNFGVVTRFRYGLLPVGPMYGGQISYPVESTADVLRLVFETRATAPDALTLQVAVGRTDPDGPLECGVAAAWLGDPSAGEVALRGFRERSDVLVDDLRPMAYLELQAMNEPMPFGMRHYWKSHFVGQAGDGLIEAIVDSVSRISAGLVLVEPIHGVAHRIPEEHAAFGARRAVANVSALAIWTDETRDAEEVAWARDSATRFEPFSLQGGGYLNYAPADEPPSRVEAAFGSQRFARLRAVKRRCDPDNRFRFNANIPPAAL
jgi:FAD/FMN-containing dehydrogenase